MTGVSASGERMREGESLIGEELRKEKAEGPEESEESN